MSSNVHSLAPSLANPTVKRTGCRGLLICALLDCTQVAAAVKHAMQEAGKSEESVKSGLNFEQFMAMLRADSRDSLDQYDDRMGGSLHGSLSGSHHGSSHGLPALLERSVRAGDKFEPVKVLDPVAEAA